MTTAQPARVIAATSRSARRRKWDETNIRFLREAVHAHLARATIADMLGFSELAVGMKMQAMKLTYERRL